MANPSDTLKDAKAIQALLVQLGASQTLRNTLDNGNPAQSSSGASGQTQSVASLLSQLQTPLPSQQEDWPRSTTELEPSNPSTGVPSFRGREEREERDFDSISIPDPHQGNETITNHAASAPSASGSQDVRYYNFQQSLPILAELATREDVVDAIVGLKKSQNTLEHQLSEERKLIRQKYEQRIKEASVKARMIGSGPSAHEARMLNDRYKDELTKFDRERAISAWERLVSQQQETLSTLGVPSMFVSGNGSDRETQQKVVQVLEGLIPP